VDKLGQKGWKLAALQNPPALHLSITSYNIGQIDDFISSVKWAVAEVKIPRYFLYINFYLVIEEPSSCERRISSNLWFKC